MKKLLITLTLIFTLCLSAFTLTACQEPHVHTFDQEVATQDFLKEQATCTEKAKYYYSCKCGIKDETLTFESGEKLGHSFIDYAYDNNATCTEDGTETATCDRPDCNEQDSRIKVGSALSHAFINYNSNSSATCVENATEIAVCDRADCQETHIREIPNTALNHNYGNWVSNGDGTHTQTCANDNSHKITKGCNGGEATCTEKATCNDCGAKYGNLADHKYIKQVAEAKYLDKAVTCTSKAKYFYSCECGAKGTETFEYGEALNHNYGNWVSNGDGTHTQTCANDNSHKITKGCNGGEATCTEKATCNDCGAKYGRLKAHKIWSISSYVNMQYDSESFIVDGNEFEFVNNFMNYVDCVTTIKFHVVKNVVLKIKYKMQVGTPSDYLIFKRNESQLLKKNSTNSWENYSISLNSGDVFLILYEKDGFTFSADEEKFWIEIQQEQIEYSDSMSLKPLCEYDIKCLTCDSVLVEKTGHNFKEKEVNDTYFSSSATCTAKAKYYYSCYCGAKGTTMFEYGELKAHTYSQLYNFDNSHHWQDATCGCDLKQNYGEHTPDSSGFCTVCDKPINPTEGVLYDYSSDGTYIEVIGYVGTATKVKIADTYDNLPVKTIYREAFKGTNITSIEIPDSVTSIGYDAFYNCKSLKSIVLPNSVTSIASEAFYGCSSLTSIEIPDSVTSIGSYAFYNCSSLTSIEIPNSVTSIRDYAFSGCSSLTSIEIPDSVISIGDYAFLGCRSLTSIVIPNSVTSIGDSAFRGCRSLQSITLPFVGAKAGVKDSDTYQYPFGYIFGTSSYTGSYSATQYYYGSSTSSTTYNYYYIPSSLKSVTITGGNILRGAFYNCSSLTSIEIPASVSSIGDYAFYGCTSLYLTENNLKYVKLNGTPYYILIEAANKNFSTYKINSQTKYIEAEAFGGCTRLSSITVPDGITSIGSYAFSNCSSLETIEIPDSVTSIGSGAFSGCSSLESIILPFVGAKADVKDSDTYQYPFGYIFGTYSYTGSYSATQSYYGSSTSSTTSTTYYIPSSLKIVTITGGNILRGAFYNCSSLTSITIPSSVTSIGSSAFYDCSSLTSLTIGSGVISIDYNAFYGCSNISKVNYLGTIDEWVQINFYGHYANPTYYSKDLYINNVLLTEANITTASKIEYYAFYNCSSLTSVTIGNSVTRIGSGAFSGCSSLQSITLPFVGADAGGKSNETRYPFGYIFGESSYNGSYSAKQEYYNAPTSSYIYGTYYIPSSLKSVTITGGNIVYSAFYNCYSLTNVVLGDSVTSIGSYAFSGCTSLTEINFNAINCADLSSNNYVFYNAGKNGGGIAVVFGDKVTKIPAYLFYPYSNNSYYLPKITSVTIGNSVTSIGSSAFYGCSKLTSIEIPNSVTSIGDWAFSYCNSLTSVVIGAGVESIAAGAFYGCNSLESVTCSDTSTWYYVYRMSPDAEKQWENKTGGTEIDATDPSSNATGLRNGNYYLYKL